MRRFIAAFFAMAFTSSVLADQKLPSTLTLTAGGDRQKSFNSAVDAVIRLPYNYLIYAGAESSRIPDADAGADLNTRGASLGVGTNPMRLWSGELSAKSWHMADDLSPTGGELGVTFAPDLFTIKLAAGAETFKFKNMPKLLFTNGEATVQDTYGAASVEYYINDSWGVRAFTSAHHYDQELSQYASGLRVKFIPQSVLTTVTGLLDHDAGLEGSYVASSYTLRLEAARTYSALDGVRSHRIRLSGGYTFNPTWRIGLELGYIKPENSTEDSEDNRFGNFSVSFSWR